MKIQSSSFPPVHLLDDLNKHIQIIQRWSQSGPLTSNMSMLHQCCIFNLNCKNAGTAGDFKTQKSNKL